MTTNRGTIERRGDGWGYRFAYRDANGSRHHVRRQGFTTKADAQKALTSALADIDAGRGTATPRITVGDYLREWLDLYERGQSKKITTTKTIRGHVTSYLIPRIGNVTLAKLTPQMVARLYADLLTDGKTGHNSTGGLAPKSVRNIAGTLHKALADGVRRGYLPRNPADNVDLPRWERPEMQPYDELEVATFMEYASKDGDPLAALWRVLFATGVRRGELLGLRWSDVDLVTGSITISQNRVEVGKVYTQTPKTRAARRTITLDPDTVTALAILKNAQEASAEVLGGWVSDLVATDLDGTPIYPRTLTRRFQATARAAGLRVIRLHDARHTHATIMFDNGVPVHVVSRRLGHTSVATTADIYVARMPAADRAAADVWTSVLRSAETSIEGRRKDADLLHNSDDRTTETPKNIEFSGFPGTSETQQNEATPRIEPSEE